MHKWRETDAPIWQKVICSRRCISLAWHHHHMSHVVTRGSCRHQEVSHSCDHHQLISDYHVTCDHVVTDTQRSQCHRRRHGAMMPGCDNRMWQQVVTCDSPHHHVSPRGLHHSMPLLMPHFTHDTWYSHPWEPRQVNGCCSVALMNILWLDSYLSSHINR